MKLKLKFVCLLHVYNKFNLSILPVLAKGKGEWTCDTAAGFYRNPEGKLTEWTCGSKDGKDAKKDDGKSDSYGKEGSGKSNDKTNDKDGKKSKKSSAKRCNAVDMLNSDSRNDVRPMKRFCIKHRSSQSEEHRYRCWWVWVPPHLKAKKTATATVPLIFDLHGGGGCASDQIGGGGFKSYSVENTVDMVVLYAQGESMKLKDGSGTSDGLWASCGSDCDTEDAKNRAKGKQYASWDDLGYFDQIIGFMVHRWSSSFEKSEKKGDENPFNVTIDTARVYMSGFSLGCMMSHRYSMERSNVIAAFGCHGGELSNIDWPGNNSKTSADSLSDTVVGSVVGNDTTAAPAVVGGVVTSAPSSNNALASNSTLTTVTSSVTGNKSETTTVASSSSSNSLNSTNSSRRLDDDRLLSIENYYSSWNRNLTALDAYKTKHNIKPMPAMLTMGQHDQFYNNGWGDFNVWSYWDNCQTVGEETFTASSTNDYNDVARLERVGSSCDTDIALKNTDVEVRMVDIKNGFHTTDSRTAKIIWEFVSKYSRSTASDNILTKENTEKSGVPPGWDEGWRRGGSATSDANSRVLAYFIGNGICFAIITGFWGIALL